MSILYPPGRPHRLSMRTRQEIYRRIELYQANTPRQIARDMMVSARTVWDMARYHKHRKLKDATSPSGGTAVQVDIKPESIRR